MAITMEFDGKIKSDVGDLNGGWAIDLERCADARKPLNAAMICVDFESARAGGGEYGDTGYYKRILADDGLDVMGKISYGRLKLDIDFYSEWFHMPKRAGEYNMERGAGWFEHRAYIEEAMRISENAVDYSRYDILYIAAIESARELNYSPTMVVRNYPVECKSGGIGLCVTFGSDMHTRRGKLLAHETGHILGLPDLYTFEQVNGGYFTCCGAYDLMGLIEAKAPDWLAWSKWRLGFIDDSDVRVVTVGESVEIKLAPVGSASGTRLAVVPLDDMTAIAAEYRDGSGLDAELKQNGVLLYRIDGRIATGQGCISVISPREGMTGKLSPDEPSELFGNGMSFTEGGIKITVFDNGGIFISHV